MVQAKIVKRPGRRRLNPWSPNPPPNSKRSKSRRRRTMTADFSTQSARSRHQRLHVGDGIKRTQNWRIRLIRHVGDDVKLKTFWSNFIFCLGGALTWNGFLQQQPLTGQSISFMRSKYTLVVCSVIAYSATRAINKSKSGFGTSDSRHWHGRWRNRIFFPNNVGAVFFFVGGEWMMATIPAMVIVFPLAFFITHSVFKSG